jgi:hypothetical protein
LAPGFWSWALALAVGLFGFEALAPVRLARFGMLRGWPRFQNGTHRFFLQECLT